MRIISGITFAFITAPLMLTSLAQTPSLQADGARYWARWRGPEANGISRSANPPLEWSETKNIRWKVEIPGRGSASPVVWGDRLYVLTAVPAGATASDSHTPRGGTNPRPMHRFMVMAIDRRDGRTVWERTARAEAPHEASHPDNGTWASSSAVTDGQHVIAFFESRGIYAYDMEGKLVWEKDLGDKSMRNQFGEGSTPALHGNHLVVVWDHTAGSYVVALDKRTGNELWRVKRDEIDTWATPLVVEHGGRAQVIVPGMNQLISYDLETGQVVWHSQGLTMNPIPSPVGADGMIYAMSGFRGNNLKAIRLAEAKGDISKSPAIVWSLDRDTPYVPSPLLYDGILYFLKTNSNILSAFEAKSGKPHYQLQRLDGLSEVFSSPVGAAGRVYVTGREGTTLVIRNAPTFEVLAKNTLDDGFDASPALVDGEIYMRGYRYLYSIGAK
ncbi:MAG: PQQ-binding-like beta-propeller repeat protein [Vicinamibacterales bacterium]|nr:PQQ-binding-like beta-propeller repeat protein [Vicinamibacterales bacterium]